MTVPTVGSDTGSGDSTRNMVVHNGMLFLIMMLNNFSNKQMDAGTAESETIQLLTKVEMKLSNEMMQSLQQIQTYINNIVQSGGYCPDSSGNPMLIPSNNSENGNYPNSKNKNGLQNDPNSNWTYKDPNGVNHTVYGMDTQQTQDEMQSLNAEYSTEQQNGTINTDTIQGFVQSFQTALQMLMSAMQSMTSMYDSVSSKEAYDASLVAS